MAMANTAYLTEYGPLARHRKELRQAARRRYRRLGLVAVVVLTAAGIGYWLTPPLGLLLAGIGAMVLFFSSIGEGSSVPAHVLTGIEGEVRTLEMLKQLPDAFLLFNQVQIPDSWLPNGQRELDFIVLGPTGLFVVEVKNAPGMIYVSPDQKHWQVARRGCGSSPNWHTMDNPLNQVQAQCQALERWILTGGMHLSTRPMVCFARPEVVLQNVDSSDIPVVVPEQLPALFEKAAPDKSLSPGQIRALTELLAGKRTAPKLQAA
jgi:hypothetical protein